MWELIKDWERGVSETLRVWFKGFSLMPEFGGVDGACRDEEGGVP